MQLLKIIGLLSLLSGCALKPYTPPSKTPTAPTTTSLATLKKLSHVNKGKSPVGKIRMQALRDAALSLGAQGGLAKQGQTINKSLERHDHLLHRVFNFNRLILDDNVLPPVLIEGRNQLEVSNDAVIHLADRTYNILRQAKFITAAPTWRDYLLLHFKTPEMPDPSLLPKNTAEKLVWDRYLHQGWQAGEGQADLIFRENLARLQRDYEGMVRYRRLLAQKIVSKPFVAKIDMGITGGGQRLTINDRVLRITAFPELQADGGTWQPQLTDSK